MSKSVKGTRTEQNLLKSFAGESQARMRYDLFAAAARKEGFEQIANIFEETALHEKEHERRYLKLLQNVSEDKVFVKDGKVWWKCIKCGYVYQSAKAYENCPVCLHPVAFMQLKKENY